MNRFPLTHEPVWGHPETWSGLDRWRTRLTFGPATSVEQEVVPRHSDRTATARIQGDPGTYVLDFPGGVREISVTSGQRTVMVGDLIRTGKHLYRLTGPDGADFQSTVEIHADRPLVTVTDEGYVTDRGSVTETRRQQMVDDRGADRVGRWGCHVTGLPATHSDTTLVDEIDLDGEWAYRQPLEAYAADLGRVPVDDEWNLVDVPHDPDHLTGKGFAWYRRRIDVPPDWTGAPVVVRFRAAPEEATVYVNGHETGFHEGDGAFQFEIGDYLSGDGDDLLAVRVRSTGRGAGLTGGISVGRVERYGVAFPARFYPGEEGGLEVGIHSEEGEPVGIGTDATWRYAPPEIEATNLTGAASTTDVRATVDLRVDRCYWTVSGAGRRLTRVSLDAEPLGGDELVVEPNDGTPSIRVGDRTLDVVCEGLIGWDVGSGWRSNDLAAAEADDTHDDSSVTGDRAHLVLAIDLDAAGGSATLAIGSEPDCGSPEQAIDQWEENVYGTARPMEVEDGLAAAWRAWNQTVVLNARNAPDDEYAGLLADFDKPEFQVYWMRDSCLSVPGAIYAGGPARTAALATAGATLDRYAENKEATGVYPDGRTHGGGGYSDGPALGVYAQAYGWALSGDEWLRDHFDTLTDQIAYLSALDERNDDRADGVIRGSPGDWRDFRSLGGIRSSGASLFVTAWYLRALGAAAAMADAAGEDNAAARWRARRRQGIQTLSRPITEGGLWLSDREHFADWVEGPTAGDWTYPDDLENVTVIEGFAPLAHAVLLDDTLAGERTEAVIDAFEASGACEPYPAPAVTPFYDIFAEAGYEGLAEEHPSADLWALEKQYADHRHPPASQLPWKGWPGNHVWGGRWPMVGAWVTLGLYRAGERESAASALDCLAESLRRIEHPGRAIEVESYGAVTREETGCRSDPAGYYQCWSAAVPIQAVVEGTYGAQPIPDGVALDLPDCPVGDGIQRVPVRGGEVSYRRRGKDAFEVTVDVNRNAATLEVTTPWPNRETSVESVPDGRIESEEDILRITTDGEEPIRLLRMPE